MVLKLFVQVSITAHFYSHLELLAEMLMMKIVNPLDVPKDDVSLATQGLRNVFAQQLLHVVIDDIVERSHLSGQKQRKSYRDCSIGLLARRRLT